MGCRLRTADCGLRTADCGLRTADCGLRTADCGLRTADCGLRTAGRGLRSLCGTGREKAVREFRVRGARGKAHRHRNSVGSAEEKGTRELRNAASGIARCVPCPGAEARAGECQPLSERREVCAGEKGAASGSGAGETPGGGATPQVDMEACDEYGMLAHKRKAWQRGPLNVNAAAPFSHIPDAAGVRSRIPRRTGKRGPASGPGEKGAGSASCHGDRLVAHRPGRPVSRR